MEQLTAPLTSATIEAVQAEKQTLPIIKTNQPINNNNNTNFERLRVNTCVKNGPYLHSNTPNSLAVIKSALESLFVAIQIDGGVIDDYDTLIGNIDIANDIFVVPTQMSEKLEFKMDFLLEICHIFRGLSECYLAYEELVTTKGRRTKTIDAYRKKFESQIKKFNTKIHILNKFSEFRIIPTIGTRYRKMKGEVKTAQLNGYDSIYDENLPGVTTICLHSVGSHIKKPCFIIDPDSIDGMLEEYANDPKMWDCEHTWIGYPLNRTNLHKYLHMKCPNVSRESNSCSGKISFNTIFTNLSKDKRKLWTIEKVYKIYVRTAEYYIQKNKHDEPNKIMEESDIYCDNMSRCTQLELCYCPNKKCDFSNLGIIHQLPSSTKPWDREIRPWDRDWDGEFNVYCKYCKRYHTGVHSHKVYCPDKKCSGTFCSVCGDSPYHEGIICQGPRPQNFDDVTWKLIKSTTRPCPHSVNGKLCGERIEKNNGCDHMICNKCSGHWCWRCLQTLDPDDPYLHICLPSDVISGEPDEHYRATNEDEDDLHADIVAFARMRL